MRRWLLRPSVVVTLVLVVLALVGGRLAAVAVEHQERRLLTERANEVTLVLAASIGSLSEGLNGIGAVLRSTDSSTAAFDKAAAISLEGTPTASVAVLKPSGGGYRVILARGVDLKVGQTITDERTRTLAEAAKADKVVPTGVLGSGDARALGFALGPPAAPTGTVLYRQTTLGPLSPPRAAATAPFSELDVVLYGGPAANPTDAVVATAGARGSLPLTGNVVTQALPVGESTWTMQVSANRTLVGNIAPYLGWLVAGVGILIALLVGSIIESAIRRRETAEALYTSEHRIAENMQRGFLPHLPGVDGLEIAARYLTGSADQQVGGDWYDLFVLDSGEIGVVIGDVLGHDVNAAVVMSRIQTALRAYAYRGAEPAAVLDALDEHIAHIQADRLTTVFYGVLGLPDPDGARAFRFANAGHLHPVLRRADGSVEELETSQSVLLGVPGTFGQGRTQAEARLEPGSILVMFTDGLVEVPGISLTDSILELMETTRGAPDDIGSEGLCALLADRMEPGELRDDVAVLTVKLTGPAGSQTVGGASAQSRTS